jgi:glycosyltransferase involved in cell wall biosynthesis
MVIPSFYPLIGGAETQARVLSSALIRRGWHVRVLTRAIGPVGLDLEANIGGVDVIRVRTHSRGKLGSVQFLLGGLRVVAKHGNGSIYHAHDLGTPALLAVLASKVWGGRSVVKLRTGAAVYERRLGSGFGGWFLRMLLHWNDGIVVVNSEVEQLLARLGFAKRVVRIPNGIDGDVFRRATLHERDHARGALGLPADHVVVLCVGRLFDVKGFDIALKTWAMLHESIRVKSTLLIVGDGPARNDLWDLAKALNVQESVLMLGEKPSLQAYYHAADVFVLPSRTEGLSNALLEAMASELPTVATAVGGAIDIIEDGVSGVLVLPDSKGDLHRGLVTLLSTRREWATMGAQGRKRVMEYAQLDMVADQLARLYCSISGG